jgi:hypothetical protein
MAARRSKGKGGDENRSVTPDHPGRDSSPRSRKCLDMTLKGKRVRCIQCCGSGMFILGPNFCHPGSASKSLNILTQKLGNPDCLSRIRILSYYPSRIQGQKCTGSRIRIPTLRAFIHMSVATIFLSGVVFIRIRLHWHHCAGSASRP